MSSLIKHIDLNQIDDKTICLVNGFVHTIEKSMQKTDVIIPESIIMIIISFYHIVECFAGYSEKNVKISDMHLIFRLQIKSKVLLKCI